MEMKSRSICEKEKHINNFYKKHSECKNHKSKRRIKRYYESKERKSNQRKINYEKK